MHDRIMSLFKPPFNALLPFPHVPTKYNTCWLLINEEVHVLRLKGKRVEKYSRRFVRNKLNLDRFPFYGNVIQINLILNV